MHRVVPGVEALNGKIIHRANKAHFQNRPMRFRKGDLIARAIDRAPQRGPRRRSGDPRVPCGWEPGVSFSGGGRNAGNRRLRRHGN